MRCAASGPGQGARFIVRLPLAGFDHHVAKPLDLAVFARLVSGHRTMAPAG